MVIIDVKKEIDFVNNNDSGLELNKTIKSFFDKGQRVIVSFNGITEVSSSFVNSAFIELLNDYSFSYIRENLGFKNSNKQINELIKNRFTFEISNVHSY
ncbi:STAS-like domain-containing protein [Streptococcus parauberis]|uniref:STAS-like domain-containing protein n=1 Tax=Streptococcus parauberis TaxID=1348 RepID=UPI000CCF19A5|nr:STAS-like domain-containing protein [Streptococcus parauberis]PNY18711.1 hypothetical protein ASN86_01665 [Streptococcus parauberis]